MSEGGIQFWSIVELGRAIRSRELTSTEITQAMLGRIAALDRTYKSYILVTAERALAAAARADAEITAGQWRGPLHGVPIAVKDLCFTKGIPTGGGSTILSDWCPDFDATVVTRLAAAGAVLLGKLMMTEGAYGDHHPRLPQPLNPWGHDRWAGASSSGSAIALAAGLAFGTLGSDTGGSIRFPSACCGVTGLKPTRGLVSRHGTFALAPSMDHIGPMARTAEDTGLLLQAIAGFDANDPSTERRPAPDFTAELGNGVAGLRIGLAPGFCAREGVDMAVREACDETAAVLASAGAIPEEVELLGTSAATLAAGWTMACAAEAAAVHQVTFPDRAAKYGPMLANLLEHGRRVRAMDLCTIHETREIFAAELRRLLERVDLLLLPAMSWAAPPIARLQGIADDAELAMLLRFTAPFDMTGSPTITFPAGWTEDGKPVGCQLVGAHWSEPALLGAAHTFQRLTDHHLRRPPLVG